MLTTHIHKNILKIHTYNDNWFIVGAEIKSETQSASQKFVFPVMYAIKGTEFYMYIQQAGVQGIKNIGDDRGKKPSFLKTNIHHREKDINENAKKKISCFCFFVVFFTA